MLHVLVRVPLALVLAVAAASKLARPAASRDALWSLLAGARGRDAPGGGGGAATLLWAGLIAWESLLAAGVAAGLDLAALAAAAFMAAGAGVLGAALRSGHAGRPCGCFGARSRVTEGAVARAGLLALAFAALPVVPRGDAPAAAWAAVAVAVVLVAAVVLRGRRAAALDAGPALGADTTLARYLDAEGAGGSVLGLAVFTAARCRACRRVAPAAATLARRSGATLVTLDEDRDAGDWQRLAIPGAPYAVVFDDRGRPLAKGRCDSEAALASLVRLGVRRRFAIARASRGGDG